ncbi:MAG: hypothetical protein WBW02_22590 [Candidatus Sulfotelmatobacter sp.]
MDASTGQIHNGPSKAAKSAMGEQLDRMVASPYFSHSKRLPSFLRFVVEHTLAGDAENLKERTLGIEIFGRDHDYDTSSDPIVRVTAAELRKRMAQYYQEPAHEDELRISLPSGSYIPEFHGPKGGNGFGQPVAESLPALSVENASPPAAHLARHWPLTIALILIAAGAIVFGTIFFWNRTHQSGFEQFWQPVLSSSDPALLCIADQTEYSVIALRDASQPEHQFVLKDNLTAVVIDDLSATVKVAGILQSSGKQYSLKGEEATTLEDLRRGPTIFLGAFDNAWTLRLTNPLRYHFANDGDISHLWIMDSTSPGRTNWTVDRGVQMATNNYRDYAILARFTDVNTGKVAIVVAGIGRGGTRVAGEFLTDNTDLTQLMRLAHAAGDKKNLEVVLSTQIIDGEPGSPKIEATYFW